MLHPKRIPLANLPTPLVPLERLGRELGGARLWLKRDDLTGLELSGNKVRKLEYILADVCAHGGDTVVTEGTPQSNHCRATAAACAKLGLRCVLLFRPEPPGGPQGNHLLDALFGAECRSFPRARFAAEREQIVSEVLNEIKKAGRAGRFVPMGASEPLGCWGYLRAMGELAEQLRAAGIGACDVLVPISSGGTYGGAFLGKLVHRLDEIRLWAVPVSDDAAFFRREVGRLCRAAAERFELPVQIDEAAMQFIDGYVGQGYAVPYPEEIQTIRLLARTEGLVLDPVYTGKAFHALIEGVRANRLGRERPAVFFHTGGIFSDFAWPEILAETI